MGVTSVDVARASGVSRTTVSYVLSGRQDVAIPESTRQRVRDAAERLGYRPSAAARALRSGRSHLVLCVLPDWPMGPVLDSLLEHLSAELAARGLSVLVHHGRGPDTLNELWRAVTPRAVVGFTGLPEADERAMQQAGIPVVTTVQDDAEPGRFAAAQVALGRLQAEHLTGLGHRRLGAAVTTEDRLADLADPRAEGVRRVCAERGLPEPVVEAVPLTADGAAHAVRTWRAAGVTAVAAYNDEVALAVLAGLRQEGLHAPGDLAVIGVDDIPAAQLADPPLSTVRQPIEYEAGHLAARLIAAIDGTTPPPHPAAGSDVVRRGST